MAVYSELDFRKLVDQKKIHPIYFFVGEESWKQDAYIQKIHALLGDSVEREVFFGDEWENGNFLASIDHNSLFFGKRLLILRAVESLSASQLEILGEYCNSFENEGLTIIGLATSMDMRKKASQLLAKSKNIVWVDCKRIQYEKEYINWVYELAKQKKIQLAPEIPLLLWQRLGSSLSTLNFALEKLSIYVSKENIITANHVHTVISNLAEEIIFAFTDAIQVQDKAKAILCLEQLYSQGEEPIAMVALLAKQYRWMLEIQSYLDTNPASINLEKELGIFPRLAKSLLASTRKLGRSKIIRSIDVISKADIALKSSQAPPKIILERLVLQLL